MKFLVIITAVLLLSYIEAKKKSEKDKEHGKGHGKKNLDTDEEIDQLRETLESLQKRMGGKTIDDIDGGCPGNNVHFFFHAHDDHAGHTKNGDQLVHIDIKISDKHHDGDHNHSMDHDDANDVSSDDDHVSKCEINDANSKVKGTIEIVQDDDDRYANISFNINYLGAARSEFPVHVHEYGDMSSGCSGLGGHYNPYDTTIDIGDLGKLMTDSNGAVLDTWKNNTKVSLFGRYSIVGRSIKIHDKSGAAVTCCLIGWAAGDNTSHDHHRHHVRN